MKTGRQRFLPTSTVAKETSSCKPSCIKDQVGRAWKPGGTIANVGVNGVKVDLHLERLWSHNVTITTRLVDTVSIPMLLKTLQSKRIGAALLITHRFRLGEILQAYDTFSKAADSKALKVIVEV